MRWKKEGEHVTQISEKYDRTHAWRSSRSAIGRWSIQHLVFSTGNRTTICFALRVLFSLCKYLKKLHKRRFVYALQQDRIQTGSAFVRGVTLSWPPTWHREEIQQGAFARQLSYGRLLFLVLPLSEWFQPEAHYLNLTDYSTGVEEVAVINSSSVVRRALQVSLPKQDNLWMSVTREQS